MNEDADQITVWERWRGKVLDSIPATLAATIAALASVSGSLWLDVRDLNHQAREWRSFMESHVDCARRSECDAVNDRLHAIERRLSVFETHVETHEKSASEWKARIMDNERSIRQLERKQ